MRIFFLAYLFVIVKLKIIPMSRFYPSKQATGVQLFPLHDSTIYPNFFQINATSNTISFVQILERDLYGILENLQRNGYLATSLCSYRYLNDTLYVVNAEPKRGFHFVKLNLSLNQLKEESNVMVEKRLKPIHFCSSWGTPTFSSVWHKTDEFLWHYVIEQGPLEAMLTKDIQMSQEGYYPEIFQVYHNGSDNLLQSIILWRKGFGVKWVWLFNVNNFFSHFRYHFDVLKHEKELEKLTGDDRSEPRLSSISIVRKEQKKIYAIRRDNGFTWKNREISKVSKSNSTISWIDREVEKAMRTMEIPSLSLSVGKYVAAYGYADILNEIKATPEHDYRIASISKTITAMAIQELIHQDKLQIDSFVFGQQGILGNDFGTKPYNSQMLSITVQHLLEHTVGSWEHYRRYEFTETLPTHHDFLTWLFDSHPPRIPVNIAHLYSNIGYIILGRIIEKISGLSYETFVQSTLFKELGINGRIGKRTRQENEVTYYSHDNANPYFNWDPVRMDSAAGWVLTASDVSEIFAHLSKNRYRRYFDLIQRSKWKFDYGRGVQIGWDQSVYHFGSLAGTEGIGFTRNDFQCAIVVNVRGRQENILTDWMLKFCRDAANKMRLYHSKNYSDKWENEIK